MRPRLYEEFSTTQQEYNSRYLGTVSHATTCKVTEARNGAYTLEMETSVNDDCSKLLLSQRIIGAKPNPFDPIQFFEIQKTERTQDGKIKVEAKHVKNFLYQICSEGDSSYEGEIITYNGTPEEVWDELMEEYITTTTPFTFESDITTKKDFYLGFSVAESLGNIMGGKEGSMVDMYGGEYHYDNYDITLLKHRGSKKNYKIQYGKNISNCVQSESCESCFTHVLPYGKVSDGNKKINFYAPLVEIPDSSSEYTKVYMLDCSDFLEPYQVGERGEHYNEVKEAMDEYALKYAVNNDLGNLNINISVTLRAELDEMAEIGLCDTVDVVLDNFGTKATAKITEVTYDSLLERWDRITIGTPNITVADLILNKRRYLGGSR